MKYILVLMVLAWGCKTKRSTTAPVDFIPDFSTGPPTMVYKAKSKYRQLVPVWLSEDKGRIVSYPGIGDIKGKGGYPLPTALSGGYYLDNRGINKNVAFLKWTYEEYSSLETLPTVQEMYAWIIDKDPLTSLCDCGSRKAFTDIEGQLNQLIKARQLKRTCRVVK